MTSARGFSLTELLVSVAIGSIVAALVGTVLSNTVQSQRALMDRDETSEFLTFVRQGLLGNRSSCNARLQGLSFPSAPTALDLGDIEYGSPIKGNGSRLTAGYRFGPLGDLQVESLTLEDATGATPTAQPGSYLVLATGKNKAAQLARYVARIRIQVVNHHGGAPVAGGGTKVTAGYRARYFDLPVLVDVAASGGKVIAECQGEVGFGEACEKVGFVYKNNPDGPPTCEPTGVCRYGGSYSVARRNGDGLGSVNSCPAGFDPIAIGSTDITQRTSKGTDDVRWTEQYQCYKCN